MFFFSKSRHSGSSSGTSAGNAAANPSIDLAAPARCLAPARILTSDCDFFYLVPENAALGAADDHAIPFTVRRGSRRRTHLAIRVGGEGEVEVLLPWRGGIPEALAAVRQRAAWIIRHVQEARSRPRVAPYGYLPGEKHFYLGEALVLDFVPGSLPGNQKPANVAKSPATPHPASRRSVQRLDGQLQIRLSNPSPERVRKALDAWYRQEAGRIFAQRLDHLLPGIAWLHAAPPLRLRLMRRRWGSCTRRGVVTLNTHLVKAPLHCVDYVLLHEIAHLREHNHSMHYYKVLEELMPHWKEARRELERLAPMILRH